MFNQRIHRQGTDGQPKFCGHQGTNEKRYHSFLGAGIVPIMHAVGMESELSALNSAGGKPWHLG